MTKIMIVLQILSAAGLAGLYSVILLSFGSATLRLAKINFDSRSGYISSSFFMGLGLLSVVWQTIALFENFTILVTSAVLLIAFLLGLKNLTNLWATAKEGLCSLLVEFKKFSWPWKSLVYSLILMLGGFAFLTLHPPNCDALAYYMVQEKLMALTHSLTPVPGYETLCHFGLNAEVSGGVMFLFGGDIIGEYASNMLVWIVGLMCAISLWSISDSLKIDEKGKWIVTLLLFTSTAFTLVMWSGKTDLFGTGLGLASIFWLLQIGKIDDRKTMILSGLLGGLAINAKMSLIVVMVPMLVMLAILLLWQQKRSTLEIFQLSLYAIVAASVTLIPLFLKNAILFNEPLAPFLYFNSNGNPSIQEVWYSPENTKWIMMTYPLALTFGQYPMQFGNLSPLLLAFMPIMFFGIVSVEDKRLKYLTLSAIFGLLFWVFLRPSILAPRYILPCLLVMLPAAGYVVSSLCADARFKFAKIATFFASLAIVVITFVSLKVPSVTAARYASVPRESYGDDTWRSIGVVNKLAKTGDRVFLASYTRLMLRSDLLQTLPHLNEMSKVGAFSYMADKDAKQQSGFWEGLYASGVKWVILDRITHEKLPGYRDLVNLKNIPTYMNVESRFHSPRYEVYEVIPKPEAPLPLQASKEVRPGVWVVANVHSNDRKG